MGRWTTLLGLLCCIVPVERGDCVCVCVCGWVGGREVVVVVRVFVCGCM